MTYNNYNKWSKYFDIRLHRNRTQMIQSYLPGVASVPHVMHPTALSSPQPKWHLIRFKAHVSVVGHARVCPSPKNCPIAWGSGSLSNTCFLAPIRVHQFSRFCIVHVRVSSGILGHPLPPSKFPLAMGGPGAPSNTWFFEPTRAHNPNGISVGSAVFAQLTKDCRQACPSPKNCPFPWEISEPSSNEWFLGPTRVLNR